MDANPIRTPPVADAAAPCASFYELGGVGFVAEGFDLGTYLAQQEVRS